MTSQSLPAGALALPGAPSIPGLSFRPLRGPEDAEALCAVHAGRRERDGVDPRSLLEGIPTPEYVRSVLSNAVEANQQDRWLVAQVGAQVAGYSRITSWHEMDGTWVYLTLGWVLPAWRGRGIGTALLHWAEDRIRRLAAAEHPGERAEFAGNASATEHDTAALLWHEGYYVAYTVLEMGFATSTPLPPPILPAGLAVRPVQPEHIPLIAASVCEAYAGEFDGNRFNQGDDPVEYARELSGPRHDPALWPVAWDGDQVAGQVLVRLVDGRAELFEVSVRPAWRRRGLGRALLLHALRDLRAQGVDEVRLYTNDNFRTRAQDLYRSVGFRVLKEFPRYRKDL
jgi:ribosomal protein S18 acetylase RimI-like enzyme